MVHIGRHTRYSIRSGEHMPPGTPWSVIQTIYENGFAVEEACVCYCVNQKRARHVLNAICAYQRISSAGHQDGRLKAS